MANAAEEATVEVYCSYSHKDADLRDELDRHLSILKRGGLIHVWYDRRIDAGEEWNKEILDHLNRASVVLLLISADFLASDYCYDIEMKRAMERHSAGEAVVIPVILRPVDWSGALFAKVQALPTDGRPVTMWSNREEALRIVAEGIRKAVLKAARAKAAEVREELKPPIPAPVPAAKPTLPERWGPSVFDRWWRVVRHRAGALLAIAVLVPAFGLFVARYYMSLPPGPGRARSDVAQYYQDLNVKIGEIEGPEFASRADPQDAFASLPWQASSIREDGALCRYRARTILLEASGISRQEEATVIYKYQQRTWRRVIVSSK